MSRAPSPDPANTGYDTSGHMLAGLHLVQLKVGAITKQKSILNSPSTQAWPCGDQCRTSVVENEPDSFLDQLELLNVMSHCVVLTSASVPEVVNSGTVLYTCRLT
jgi:hypothetical protein